FVENGAGGLFGLGAAILNFGTVQVTNTTFARNFLGFNFPLNGIAIANFGMLSLTNSTLAENTFSGASSFRSVISGNARTFLQNTIVTHNAEDTLVQDCSGPITSLGNNLISDTAGCGIVNRAPTYGSHGRRGFGSLHG